MVSEAEDRKPRGANLPVCEFTLKCCPYCGSQRIEEQPKLRPQGYLVHPVICLRCMGIFFIPCED